MKKLSTIATISIETGIAKEVLRKWEERYGFPVPQRDPSGHRAYPQEQTARLKLIKRLIDGGMRPAQVVPLDESQLQLLLPQAVDHATPCPSGSQQATELMALLRARDRTGLAERMATEIRLLGLERFIVEVMASLNSMVGAAWERGEISIRDEHFYTEVVQGLLRKEIVSMAKPAGKPRMLLTTPSGELHTLGILMAEAIASLHGANCTSLGAQTPIEEIPHAVDDLDADIVCLCFSAAYPKKQILPLLKVLRHSVPKECQIWIGGAGVSGLDRSPRGIHILLTMPELIEALRRFKPASHGLPKQLPSSTFY